MLTYTTSLFTSFLWNLFNIAVQQMFTLCYLLATIMWSYLLFVVFYRRPRCTCRRELSAKTVIVTGGTDGVGKVIARSMAERGAHVILPVRNMEKGRRIAEEIYEKTSNRPQIIYVDFSNLKTVRDCAIKIKKSTNKVDILINNAGVGNAVGKTCDGIPILFGVNFIGPFLFTYELLDLLRNSGSGRIIFVSSVAHFYGNIDFENLDREDGSWVKAQFKAYAESKFAQVVLTKHLARIEKKYGISVFSCYPGWTFTSIFRTFPLLLKIVTFPIFYLFLYVTEEGAQTQIHCALSRRLSIHKSGHNFTRCAVAKSNEKANDKQLGEKLWNYSLKLISSILDPVVQCNTF